MPRVVKRLVWALGFIFICGLQDGKAGNGIRYYVDAAAGNDEASGTEPSVAWRTVSRVNRAALRPGDQVLFKRGRLWREQLNVKDSGKPGSPIVFSTYGEGNAPILWGADCVSAACAPGPNWWNRVKGPTPIYQAKVKWKAGVFLLDGKPLRFIAWKPNNAAVVLARMTPGTYAFDWQNRLAYVWLPDGSTPDKHIVEAAKRDNTIRTNGAHDIQIEGLALRASSMGCVLLFGARSWIFDHMDVRYCGGRFKDEHPDPKGWFYMGDGFEISSKPGKSSIGVIIRNSVIGEVFDVGIAPQLYMKSTLLQDVTIENTEIFNTPLAGITFSVFSDLSMMQGLTIRNTTIHDAGRGWAMDENPNRRGTGIMASVNPGLKSSVSGIVVEDSTIMNNKLDGMVFGYNTGVTRIERNKITRNQYGIAFYDDQAKTKTGGIVLDNDNSGNSEAGLCFYVPNSSTGLQARGNTKQKTFPVTFEEHANRYKQR
jgi:hypothetical protein